MVDSEFMSDWGRARANWTARGGEADSGAIGEDAGDDPVKFWRIIQAGMNEELGI